MSDDFATPPEIFEPLNKKYQFNLDLAASETNKKATAFYSLDRKCPNLIENFSGWAWCNPPYSKPNLPFFTQAVKASVQRGSLKCVMLLPATPDAGWFFDLIHGCQVLDNGIEGHGALEGMVHRYSGIRFFMNIKVLRRRIQFLDQASDGTWKVSEFSAATGSCLLTLSQPPIP